MDLFSPKRPDGRAEWKVIYDEVIGLSYGAEVEYTDIAKWLDTEDREVAYRAVARCNKQFTQESKPRVLGNVRGKGYRVLKPSEYTPAAIGMQKKARRRMTTAVDLMRAAPLTDMTSGQREWAHRVTMTLMDNELRLRSQEQWRDDAERRLKELEQRVGVSEPIDLGPDDVQEAS